MNSRKTNEAKARLPNEALRQIIALLLTGGNYRDIVTGLVGVHFLEVAMNFLKHVAEAKMDNRQIDRDWYRENFIAGDLDSDEIANNAGTNKKTINNAKQTARKEVVIATSLEHYESTLRLLNELMESFSGDSAVNINLKIKINKVEVELDLTETFIVVNALFAKRLSMRSGSWGLAGKRVEKPLMVVLCRLFGMSEKHYRRHSENKNKNTALDREVDFYLCPPGAGETQCEIKLMGKGNPESADSGLARNSKVFVADKMSDKSKKLMDDKGILWVELHSDSRFERFQSVLDNLRIPYDKSAVKNITPDRIKKVIREVVV